MSVIFDTLFNNFCSDEKLEELGPLIMPLDNEELESKGSNELLDLYRKSYLDALAERPEEVAT